jgi:pantoate--beta-alanine ligase
MQVIETVAALREARGRHTRLGLVPTMGYLHAGHLSLVHRARQECGAVAVSIFVNPTQFGPNDDFARYPRDLERDGALLASAGVDVVFAPDAAEMYPPGAQTSVSVERLAASLCGAHRPGHFRGVATVVLKLFNIIQPGRAYFGEKDAQQLAIIRRMVKDLDVPVTVVPVATVREPDGLAMSSRNRHLTPEERQRATVLSQALFAARNLVLGGERSAQTIRTAVAPFFDGVQLEYFSIFDPETLTPIECIENPVLIAGAIWLGSTRLIDNVTATP